MSLPVYLTGPMFFLGESLSGGSLSRRSLSRESLSLSGRPPRQRPPYGYKRKVRILLECLFVVFKIRHEFSGKLRIVCKLLTQSRFHKYIHSNKWISLLSLLHIQRKVVFCTLKLMGSFGTWNGKSRKEHPACDRNISLHADKNHFIS